MAIIGCGNLARSDDAAGPQVVRALAQGPLGRDPRVRLLDAGTDGMAVIYAARGCGALIVVDAARSGAGAGAIFEVPGAALAMAPPPAYSLHDFRWEHALFAGRRVYGEAFPADVVVLLIEAQSTGYGMELSPAVERAVRTVASRAERLALERLA